MREADAVVALMQHDGIYSIVPLWRNDAGNNGLHDSVKAAFEHLGGTHRRLSIPAKTTTDFSLATTAVASRIQLLLAAGAQPSSVAIYLAAFDGVVGVFNSATSDATLTSTRWYGSDGVALSAVFSGNANAAAFASSAYYPNPTFGLSRYVAKFVAAIANAIQARTFIAADAFALSAYDALFVVERALRVVGDSKTSPLLRQPLFIGDSYSGVTGSTALDMAGDRLSADFDFWAVRLVNGSYTWVRIGTYTDGTFMTFLASVTHS